jgi:hypothetical protein
MSTDQDRADKLAAAASLAADIGAARGAVFGQQLAALRAYLREFEDAVRAALKAEPAAAERPEAPTADRQRLVHPWQDLKTSGLLWLINAAVLHPRGYALALVYLNGAEGDPVGWQLLGDGSQAWVFLNDDSQEPFTHVESFLGAHRD